MRLQSPTHAAPRPPLRSITPAAVKTAALAPAALTVAAASPRDVVSKFYAAFEAKDTATMESLYAPNVKFADMLFSYDDRAGTMHMWKKILSDPATKIRFTLDRTDGDRVHGHWVADYTLGGRPVHNELTTQMVVKNGKIVQHQDASDWDKWAPQALPLGNVARLPIIRELVQMAIRFSIDM